MDIKAIKTLTITFDLPLYPRQIPHFRGAIAELVGWDRDLFHNHQESGKNINRYPLIQYRLRRRKASLFALEEGVEAIQPLLTYIGGLLPMEGREIPLRIDFLNAQEHTLHMTDQPRMYKAFKWLPFNDENYQRWLQCNNLSERVALMERILASQIIAFVAAMEYQLPRRLEVNLQHIQLMEKVKTFGVPMVAFNVTFSANIALPPEIAFGKAVSHGFGWTKPVYIRDKTAAGLKGKSPAAVPVPEENGQLLDK